MLLIISRSCQPVKCHNFIHFIWQQQQKWTHFTKSNREKQKKTTTNQQGCDLIGFLCWSTSFVRSRVVALNKLTIFGLQFCTCVLKTCRFCLSTCGWNASCEIFRPFSLLFACWSICVCVNSAQRSIMPIVPMQTVWNIYSK